MSDHEILSKYSLVVLMQRYSEFLYDLFLNDETPRHMKYSVFEALTALHSI